ncbi:MAG: hypothetical protein NWE92_12760 [Candidatus Bathyarchaeota archaeon]|nr:hypothetical protein [Candidatus Bathyarchaeota archaeon]
MAVAPTCHYVERVVKFSYATPKQTQKHVANPKSKRRLQLFCGVP